MTDYAIEMRGITKRFGTVVANNRVDLKVKKGTIHAILGENGSGKSTLMNVLFGLHSKDEGEVLMNGEVVEIQSPLQAIQHNIGMIHQEFMLLQNLSVRDNLIVGMLEKNSKLKMKNLLQKEDKIFKRLGLSGKLDVPVKELSVGEQQKVEIAKTLYQGAEVIVLDEPTSVLTPQEGFQLFEILKKLEKEGKTIILITHKLEEVIKYSKAVTVLRAGEVVDAFETKDVDRYSLADRMVGRKVLFSLDEKKVVGQEEAISIHDITYRDKKGVLKVDHVDLTIRKGEILGIAGVDGNGQTELSEILAGLQKPTEGSYTIDGEVITHYSAKALKEKGVSFIPGDRKNYGAVLDLSIEDNLILKSFKDKHFSLKGFLNRKAIEENSVQKIEKYLIKAESGKLTAGSLSGGNMQKVILARELSDEPKFLICVQPTRGLDIGAVEYVQNLLIEARNKGISILLISTELDEILALSDRIAVIYDGRIKDVVENTKDIDLGMIGLMMAGGKNPDEYIIGGSGV